MFSTLEIHLSAALLPTLNQSGFLALPEAALPWSQISPLTVVSA